MMPRGECVAILRILEEMKKHDDMNVSSVSIPIPALLVVATSP